MNTQSKATRTYAQSGQYQTSGESCLSNMISEQCHKLSMSIESSNVEQKTPKEKGVEAPRRHDKK